jgi:hypothetical protein
MTNKLVVIINSLKYKLQLPPEPLTKGLPPPDPRSLCPLSSTQFVEPPLPEKNSWVRHCLCSPKSFVPAILKHPRWDRQHAPKLRWILSTWYHPVTQKHHILIYITVLARNLISFVWSRLKTCGTITRSGIFHRLYERSLRVQLGTFSALEQAHGQRQYCLTLLHSMFLLNKALFSPSYFYWICVLILLRTSKLDRTVKVFGGSPFKSRPEHQLLSLIFSWFSSVSPAECQDGTTNFLPHLFRPIVQYCTIILHYLVLLLITSVNKSTVYRLLCDKRYHSLINRVSCRITLCNDCHFSSRETATFLLRVM